MNTVSQNHLEPIAVPLLDLKAQFAPLRDEIEAAIREVCDTQHFVMGPKVTELEERVAAYSQCGYGIGVSSGTDALLVALMALDIGPGDAVITTPFTFFATGGVISRLGATPVFCDIDRETYNLDPNVVRTFLEEQCEVTREGVIHTDAGTRVRAIMPVHLFGQMADMRAFEAIASEYELRLIEDAAQAIGSEDDTGRRAGSCSDIGCFSFFPSKNLGAFGDGGMCVTSDPELAERLRILRVHGGKPKYYHSFVGGNFRLDAIQAAVLLVKLKHLDRWSVARANNAESYRRLLKPLDDVVELPFEVPKGRHIYNQFTIRVDDRNALRQALQDANIGSEIYYPVPLHLQECFKFLNYGMNSCAIAEAAADEVVSLPIYPELSQEQQQYVVAAVIDHLQH